MQNSIALAFAALAATSAAAVAQEAFDWSGFYAGVHSGYGTGTTYLSNAIVNGTPICSTIAADDGEVVCSPTNRSAKLPPPRHKAMAMIRQAGRGIGNSQGSITAATTAKRSAA